MCTAFAGVMVNNNNEKFINVYITYSNLMQGQNLDNVAD